MQALKIERNSVSMRLADMCRSKIKTYLYRGVNRLQGEKQPSTLGSNDEGASMNFDGAWRQQALHNCRSSACTCTPQLLAEGQKAPCNFRSRVVVFNKRWL